jgi:NAD-dependent SIR2 family protein deacetylase
MPKINTLIEKGRAVITLYPRVRDKARICTAARRAGLQTSVYVLQTTLKEVETEERRLGIKWPHEQAPKCGLCGGPISEANARRAEKEGRIPYCRKCQRKYGSKELKQK